MSHTKKCVLDGIHEKRQVRRLNANSGTRLGRVELIACYPTVCALLSNRLEGYKLEYKRLFNEVTKIRAVVQRRAAYPYTPAPICRSLFFHFALSSKTVINHDACREKVREKRTTCPGAMLSCLIDAATCVTETAAHGGLRPCAMTLYQIMRPRALGCQRKEKWRHHITPCLHNGHFSTLSTFYLDAQITETAARAMVINLMR